MGILVSAAVAGRLVDRHERIIRGRIERGDLPNARKGSRGQWLIDVDDLAAIPGWVVDREELARLELRTRRGHAGLVARVEQLEARVRMLEARLAAQVTPLLASAPTSTHDDRHAAATRSDMQVYPARSDLPLSASQGHSAQFSHKTAAAKWLAEHGVNPYTARSWRGWPPEELTPRGVLRFAIETRERSAGDWRVTWRLRRCDDPACVCRELLD